MAQIRLGDTPVYDRNPTDDRDDWHNWTDADENFNRQVQLAYEDITLTAIDKRHAYFLASSLPNHIILEVIEKIDDCF